MSIQAQLKKFASDPSTEKTSRDFLPDQGNAEGQGQMQEMFEDHPIPGQSLTQDPEQRMPYETPPEYTDQREFIDYLFNDITEQSKLPGLLDVLRKKVPVEDVALRVLRGEIRKGAINTDMLMLSIEPTIYMLIALATYAEIDPVLYPEEDFDSDEANEDMALKFRQAAQAMREPDEDPQVTLDDFQAPSVTPQSLMPRAQSAVESVSGENIA